MSKERKKPGGIALRPALWRRIEALAERQGKSKNEVMEEVLSLHLPVAQDFEILREDSRNIEGRGLRNDDYDD